MIAIILMTLGIIGMFVYLFVVIPYKQGYTGGLKGLIEYNKQQDTKRQQKQTQTLNDEYEKLRQEFFEYFKRICDITQEESNVELDAVWVQATYDKKIFIKLGKARLAVEETKRQYEQISKIKEEYDSFVNDFFDEDGFPEGGLKDMINIKKKFEENYKFNENPAISFTEAGRIVVDDLKRKQECYDVMKKRGIDVEPLSVVEEIVLIHLKSRVEEWEKKLENIKREAKEEAMLSAIEDLKGQNMYLQQLLNNRK